MAFLTLAPQLSSDSEELDAYKKITKQKLINMPISFSSSSRSSYTLETLLGGLSSSLNQLHGVGSDEFKSELSTAKFWSNQAHSSATKLRKRLFSKSVNYGEVLPGEVRNSVGKKLRTAIGDSPTVTLDKVHYCVTFLTFLQSVMNSSEAAKEVSEGNTKEIRSLLNHAFLVVEMYDEVKKQPLFLRADKYGDPDNAGVHIRDYKPDEFLSVRQDVVAFTLSCDKKAVTFNQVLDILEDCDPDYCLRDRCCWDHAREMALKLLEACAALPNLSEQENARLREEIDSVEAQVVKHSIKNVPLFVERYFELVKENIHNLQAKIPWLQ